VFRQREFPTTHWSLVVEAGNARDAKRMALERLLRTYLPPLRTYLVYTKGFRNEEAEDLLQSFIADQILERGLLQSAEQDRGRFRSFILTALDNFCINQWRFEKAKKRRPKRKVSLDEALTVADPTASPGDVFDLAWARQVLAQAIHLMKAECQRSRPELWRLFEARVLAPALHGESPLPYAQMVQDFGFVSPMQAANAIVTANRMFARMLRSVIGHYAKDPQEVEEEIRDLWRKVSVLAGNSEARDNLIQLSPRDYH
jgi:RNA polymerase sigma-70 factor (ECF subfamily)